MNDNVDDNDGLDIVYPRATYEWALSVASPAALDRLEAKVKKF